MELKSQEMRKLAPELDPLRNRFHHADYGRSTGTGSPGQCTDACYKS